MVFSDNHNPDKKYFRIKRKILIEPEMYYSGAFKSLSASAIRSLMRCLQKRKWNNVKLGGKKHIRYDDQEGFIFPYSEAEFLGIGTTQHWKNMKTLVEMGFLDIIHQGGWYQKHEKEKDYSIYKISDRWRHYGTQNFKRVEKKKVLQPDYYIRENIHRQKSKATSRKRSGHLHASEGDVIK